MLHSEKSGQPRMLSGISVDTPSLAIAVGNSRVEVSTGWNHDESNASLRRATEHVLVDIPVPMCVATVTPRSQRFPHIATPEDLFGARPFDSTGKASSSPQLMEGCRKRQRFEW